MGAVNGGLFSTVSVLETKTLASKVAGVASWNSMVDAATGASKARPFEGEPSA